MAKKKSDATIYRPRLGDHVSARRHVVDGESLVVLHDSANAQVCKLGSREYTLLQVADGTRDLTGIRLAAEKLGVAVTGSALAAFMAQLDDVGLLDSSVAKAPTNSNGLDAVIDPDALVQLPDGIAFKCNGEGSCCRLYPTTIFSSHEKARARTIAPHVLLGSQHDRGAFSPTHQLGADAVAMVDGRCAYLDGNGGCKLHRGPDGRDKPLGCSLFPKLFVNDGMELRATLSPECACVFTSPVSTAREVGPRVGDLPESIHIHVLPDVIALAPSRDVERAPFRDFDALVAARLAEIRDCATFFYGLASGLDAGLAGVDLVTSALSWTAEQTVDSHAHELAHLAPKLKRRVDQDSWRAPTDLARLIPMQMLATFVLESGHDAPESSQHAHELRYARLLFFGHLLAFDDGPVSAALRRRAARIRVARQIVGPKDSTDPVWRWPLALVEGFCRGFGIS